MVAFTIVAIISIPIELGFFFLYTTFCGYILSKTDGTITHCLQLRSDQYHSQFIDRLKEISIEHNLLMS